MAKIHSQHGWGHGRISPWIRNCGHSTLIGCRARAQDIFPQLLVEEMKDDAEGVRKEDRDRDTERYGFPV